MLLSLENILKDLSVSNSFCIIIYKFYQLWQKQGFDIFTNATIVKLFIK